MATWTEAPAGSGLMLLSEDAGDVCPTEWIRSFDRADITTHVILGRSAPTGFPDPGVVEAWDNEGRTLYGDEPFERSDLWTQNADDVWWIAGRILATRAARNSMPRIRAVTINAESGGDAAVDLLATLSIFQPSRYRGRLRNDRGLVFDTNFFAVGVKHTITAETWTAEISLDRSWPWELLADEPYAWDVAHWDHALWS